MFYNASSNPPAGTEVGVDRVPGSRVLQHLDVPWDAPGSSECRFRMLRLHPHVVVSVAD